MPLRVYKYEDEDGLTHYVEELVRGEPPQTITVTIGDASYTANLVPVGQRMAGAHGSMASNWAAGREDADLPPINWDGQTPLK